MAGELPASGFTIPHRQVRHEQPAGLLRRGRRLSRNGCIHANILIGLQLLPVEGCATQQHYQAGARRQKVIEHG